MNDVTLVGHARVVEHLKNALRQDRLGHALLFLGPRGVGRETCARALAAGLLCASPDRDTRLPFGCGTCRSCRMAEAGSHADLHWVMTEAEAVTRERAKPDGKRKPSRAILVEQVRALSRSLRMRPHEGRARVAIVVDAHLMNANAANALLKTLEEPGERSTLMLLAPHTRALLPTVVSRCQRLSFGPLADAELRQVLSRLQVQDVDHRVAAAAGSVHDALAWQADEGVADGARVDAVLDALLRGDATQRLDAVERIGKDRGTAEHLLSHVERRLAQTLRELAVAWDERDPPRTTQLLRLLDGVGLARRALSDNANVSLALEQLLLAAAPR